MSAIERAADIRCPVIGFFGNDDQNPVREMVNQLEEELKKQGKQDELHRYDGAGHGFQDFNDSNRFRKAQSDDAWQKAIAFLDRRLK